MVQIDNSEWEQVFYLLEVVQHINTIENELLLKLSERLNVERDTLFCLIQLYTLKPR